MFTVERRMDPDDLRSLCIRQHWYTRGTNEEYGKLMKKCYAPDGRYSVLTDDKIEGMARDIYSHTDIEQIKEQYGCDEDEVLRNILTEVYNRCMTYVTEVRED